MTVIRLTHITWYVTSRFYLQIMYFWIHFFNEVLFITLKALYPDLEKERCSLKNKVFETLMKKQITYSKISKLIVLLQLAYKHCNAKHELRSSNLKRWFQWQSQNCELTICDTSIGIIYLHQIPKPLYAWNLSYWEPKSKDGPTKTVLEVLNDIEVWRADSPDGVNIAELFLSMFIIDVINLKLSIVLDLLVFFFSVDHL